MPAESTGDRITRMLAMLSYLAEHDEVPVPELAAHFRVSEAQILKDVDLLWVTGLPGYYADDLIDFSPSAYDEAIISLREGQGLSRRVPLAPREAVALVAAVASLREFDSGASAEVIDSVQEKLQGLVPAVLETRPANEETLALVRGAIAGGGDLAIRYVSAEDEVTERVISPEGLTTDGSTWYLEAWCHSAGGRRMFRLDRMLAAESAEGPPLPLPAETTPGQELPEEVQAVLVVDPAAGWLAEDVPGATGADITWQGAPAVRIGLASSRAEWLVRQILSLGGMVKAVEPASLRAAVEQRASRTLDAYAAITPVD